MDKRAFRVLAAAVTRSKLEALFHLPLQEAATHVGIGRTLFKRVCRREGIRQWPQLSKSGARQAKQVEQFNLNRILPAGQAGGAYLFCIV